MAVEALSLFPGLTEERVVRAEPASEIFAVAWSPDGKWFATGAKDTLVQLWSADGTPIATLADHEKTVLSVAFSPSGKWLASGSVDGTMRLWDLQRLRCTAVFAGHTDRVTSVAWSRTGRFLLSGSDDGTVRCWDHPGGYHGPKRVTFAHGRFVGSHEGPVNCVAMSPSHNLAASAGPDPHVLLWDVTSISMHPATQREGHVPSPVLMYMLLHPARVHSVCFLPQTSILATACDDATIRIWDSKTGALVRILEGHTTAVRAIACTPDGQFLISKSDGGTVRLWRCDSWQLLGFFYEETTTEILSVAISCDHVIASYADNQHAIRLSRMNPDALLPSSKIREQYCNAKVVLVGDSGVGKSGLALALSGREFAPTESTHVRNVWQLEERVVSIEPELRETREIVLWDLAGQPGYRVIHQLHLHDTTVALIVFDARSDTDPLAGVRHWDRALRQARRGQDIGSFRKVLVIARTDRGGVALGKERLAQLRAELGIDERDVFETSAKLGWGTAQLREALNLLIEWERLPKITSTRLFHEIKLFVGSARERAQRLITVPALCDAFVAAAPERADDVRAELETCVRLLESRGVVRRFTFGNYVLLEPEVLDSYASAIVEAAREEPDGLGIIAEDDVRAGRLRIPMKRLPAHEEEILLIATIESLVRGEIALRETTDNGAMLLFPAQSTREPPPEVAGMRPSHRVAFEGSARSVYATLAVRLTRSGVFKRGEIWRDGLIVTDAVGARCGVRLVEMTEAGGELEVLASRQTAPAIRAQLEQFVVAHVAKRAIVDTVRAEPVVSCACGEVFPPSQVRKCVERGKAWITCPVCDERTVLGGAPGVEPEQLVGMDRDADLRREREAASITLAGKERARDFDVFLCHSGRDKPEVKVIGNELRTRGYLPWLDEWELPPGQPWLPELEAQIESIRAAAVFIGGDGTGPWQQVELRALLAQFVKRGCSVIPVILPSVTVAEPPLPSFLQEFTWVDCRRQDPEPIGRLIWGITRVKPR